MREHPCIFVVGKGGVGKTTTAGAIALALADAGRLTHLVTTDPAESISHLFHVPLPSGQPTGSPCTDRLTLEAFDADTWGEAWLGPKRAALAEIIDRGTYLERADVDGLLTRTVPGVNEAMGALRIGRLAAATERGVVEHVVIDTAPTGHTLRLLDAGTSLGAWVDALRAMATKADAVGSALVRGPVRLSGERVLDEIDQELSVIDDLLRTSAFVIVQRSDSVVLAETARLAGRLAQRGLRILACVSIGGDPPHDSGGLQVNVPLLEDATGCAGLRRFVAVAAPRGAGSRPSQTLESARPLLPERPAAPLIRSAPWRLIWFAGKGGVGKSTCAAAAAVGLAPERSVTLYSTDPAGSLGDLFATPLGKEPVEIIDGLRVQQVEAKAAFAAWVSEYRADVERVFAALGLDQAAQLDRRVMESLLDFAPPGIDEIVSLERILDALAADETLIIDTAPTGHFMRLLQMPDLALEWLHALMRVLLNAGAAASLDALSRRVLAFAKRLRDLRTALADPEHSAVFVVTLDQPMVREETAMLRGLLADAGIPEAGLIVNRAHAAMTAGEADPFGGTAGGGRTSDAATHRVIMAPELATPPVGVPALRSFFETWELA